MLIMGAALGVRGAACRSCHAAIVDSFAMTGMGRSISVPRVEAGDRLTHTVGGMTKAMAFAVGSGNAGKSYVWRLGDSLFQSPLAWYREKGRWDLAPGYERDTNPNFYRPIVEECLTCHTGGVRTIAGTQSRYPFAGAPPAIGCERCHGEGEAHAARPSRGNIVNPVRLAPKLRDSVCESCHLGGEARIPNPGRAFADFVPGMALEEVFSVYVSGDAAQRVTGHVEQMASARCASDPKLWCGSCHDPHRQPAATDRPRYYRERCVQCHAVMDHETKRGGDCAACHMPKAQAHDGGHTAFTDHRIRLKGESRPGPQLRAWRKGPFEERGLALAYLTVSEKRGSLADLQEAVRRLNPLLAGKPDRAMLTAAGMLALRQNKARQAVEWLRQVLSEEPESARNHANLAAAFLAAGDRERAATEAREAMRIEPLLEEPYGILAEAEPAKAAEWRALYRQRARR